MRMELGIELPRKGKTKGANFVKAGGDVMTGQVILHFFANAFFYYHCCLGGGFLVRGPNLQKDQPLSNLINVAKTHMFVIL